MRESRIWVYGDSFTEGIGTLGLPGPDIDLVYGKRFGRYFWGNYYSAIHPGNFILQNKGKAGASTQFILNSVLEDIDSWKEGDKVIVGLSDPFRIAFPYDRNPKQRGYMHIGYPHISSRQWSELVDNHQINCMSAFSRGLEDRDSIDPLHKGFFDKVVINNSSAYLKQALYFKKLINNILRLVRDRGVEGLVWDQSLWPYFEDLSEWSARGIDDFHWSPNGNIQFAHLLKDCMERGIYDLAQNELNFIGKDHFGSAYTETPQSVEEEYWREIGVFDYIRTDGLGSGKRMMINTSYATCPRVGDGYGLDDDYHVKYRDLPVKLS